VTISLALKNSMIAVRQAGASPGAQERSVRLVAQGGQDPLKIFAARTARAQVRRDARISLFR
jgi:hypothetical protein